MIDEIICIGTSFTEGGGLNPKLIHSGGKDPAVIWYETHMNIIIKSMSEYAWPSQLETLSNIKTRNLGKCGSSIDYLIRNTEEIIENEDCSNKLFILEYSNWGRSELWSSNDNQWIIANWGPRDGIDAKKNGYAVMLTTDYNFGNQLQPNPYFKIYEDYLDTYFNEKEYLIKRDRNFLNLLYKLNAKGIKFQILLLEPLFWAGLSTDTLFHNNLVTDENLYGLMINSKLNIQSLTNDEILDGHPSIEGHQYIARLIYDKIKSTI
jgi:lysophospholipase L1-like esterase